MRHFFITGIGTDVGKTIASAILTEALQADYWKPIQAGDLLQSDTVTVKSLVGNESTIFHPEVYRLNKAMSPHAAAKADEVTIDLDTIKKPNCQKNLIIEGAGGVLVPLNDEQLVIDLIKKIDVPVILIAQNYLGSINHTLLTFEAIKNKGIAVAGIIFNGDTNEATEEYILKYTELPCILRIRKEEKITPKLIREYSKKVQLPL